MEQAGNAGLSPIAARARLPRIRLKLMALKLELGNEQKQNIRLMGTTLLLFAFSWGFVNYGEELSAFSMKLLAIPCGVARFHRPQPSRDFIKGQ